MCTRTDKMDIKTAVAEKIAALAGVSSDEILGFFETPPSPDKGDIALPCFKLARSLRKAPPAIAAELAASLSGFDGIVRAEPVGG